MICTSFPSDLQHPGKAGPPWRVVPLGPLDVDQEGHQAEAAHHEDGHHHGKRKAGLLTKKKQSKEAIDIWKNIRNAEVVY